MSKESQKLSESDLGIPSFDLYGEGPAQQKFCYAHAEPLHVRNEPNAWQIGMHRHPHFHQVSVVLSGGCTFTLDGKYHVSNGSSVVFIRAGVVHAFDYQPGSHGYLVTCSSDLMNEITGSFEDVARTQSSILTQQGSPILSKEHRAKLKSICETLVQYSAPPENSYLEEVKLQLAYFWLVLKRAVVLEPQLKILRSGSEVELFDRFRRLLRKSFTAAQNETTPYHNVRTVEFFASLLEVSPYVLNKCCRKSVGQLAKQMIKEAVLAEAIRLLLYSTLPSKVVSEKLGYSSPSHFIRFFTSEIGTTPQRFRRNHLETGQ